MEVFENLEFPTNQFVTTPDKVRAAKVRLCRLANIRKTLPQDPSIMAKRRDAKQKTLGNRDRAAS